MDLALQTSNRAGEIERDELEGLPCMADPMQRPTIVIYSLGYGPGIVPSVVNRIRYSPVRAVM